MWGAARVPRQGTLTRRLLRLLSLSLFAADFDVLQVPASVRSSSPDLAALLESMLSIDPAQRPTAEQVHGRLRQILMQARPFDAFDYS